LLPPVVVFFILLTIGVSIYDTINPDYEFLEVPYINLWYLKKNMSTVKIAEGLLLPYPYGWIDDNICFNRLIKKSDEIFFALYLRNITTGKEILLAEKVVPPYLLSDGHLFYFQQKNKECEIEKISFKNFNKTSLGTINHFQAPSVSPDGLKIAFIRKNQIWVRDLKTEEENQITNTSDIKKYLLWTKDGNYIIYCTNRDLIKIKMVD